jgi:hypothetical protein
MGRLRSASTAFPGISISRINLLFWAVMNWRPALHGGFRPTSAWELGCSLTLQSVQSFFPRSSEISALAGE